MRKILIAPVGLAILIAACQRNTVPTAVENGNSPTALAERTSRKIPTISASPNPIQPGTKLETTTISWNAEGYDSAEVFVSDNGTPEKLFASGPSGTKTAPWIAVGFRYDFRLYATSARKELLATVTVTGGENK